MLDRRWRKGVEQGLGPIGDRLRRLGITADALTVFGLAVLGGDRGPHRVRATSSGRSSASRSPGSATSSTVRSPAGAARRARAAPSSTRSPTAASDALLFGGVAWHLAARSSYLPILAFAVAACSMLISYERARAESLGPRRARRPDGARRALRPARHRAGVPGAGPDALADARAHRLHRDPALRARVPARGPPAASRHPARHARGVERPATPLRSWWMARGAIEGQRPRARPRSERRGARPYARSWREYEARLTTYTYRGAARVAQLVPSPLVPGLGRVAGRIGGWPQRREPADVGPPPAPRDRARPIRASSTRCSSGTGATGSRSSACPPTYATAR